MGLTQSWLKASLARWRRKESRDRRRLAHDKAMVKRRVGQLAVLPPVSPKRGLDYAWSHPNDASLKQFDFACRYLSHDPKKNLTPAEARHLAKLGLDIVVVWESTAKRALGGRTAGIADAQSALALAQPCGLPPFVDPITHVPGQWIIYFGVDFDETPGQALAVLDYFKGASYTLGVEHTGVYGGYWAVKRLFDAKLVTGGWQTYAWSGGQWDPRAQIQQYKNGVKIGGADVDLDRAVKANFGQWRPV